MVITKAQRIAIKRVFDRCPLYLKLPYRDRYNNIVNSDVTSQSQWTTQKPLTYKEFRKRIQHGYDCIMVQWCGMWLGIETDGYTHS